MGKLKLFLFICFFLFILAVSGIAGGPPFRVVNSDNSDDTLNGFFDLRNRETFIQITNVDTDPAGNNLHIQIFDVSNNCNENNFFDFYTVNDTHVYNLRDITTNDGNDSGVVLPDGAYGIFIVNSEGGSQGPSESDKELIGNMRILDDNGYEYRTNLQGEDDTRDIPDDDLQHFATFNFNTKGGVTFSDIVGIPFDDDADSLFQANAVANILDIWVNFDVNIFDLNENVFSCRNVVFACVNQNHPLLEELLEEVNDSEDGSANVASFEYGINEAIPHSKGGELLCPGNQITEGFVRIELIEDSELVDEDAIYFIGLNNGNGRGSLDAIWVQNSEIDRMGM